MTKRKRETPEGDDSYNWGDKKLRLQRLRLEQKVQHGVVLLHRALKVARGFERQKLGRREKTARQESDRMLLNRHMNEVEALKALDLHQTAEKYLIKQMTKTKRIAESAAFIHLKLAERISKTEEKKSDAEANVTARLFNSNPVKKVFPGLMDDIRDILDLSGDKPSKKKGTTKEDKQSAKTADEDIEMSDDEGTDQESSASRGEEMDMSRFDGLVASDSEDDESAHGDYNNTKPTTAKYNPMDDLSLSPTPSIASDNSAAITTKSSKAKQKSTTATTFLPTLMGGYWSGSESEPENDSSSAIPVRKNRMGQQARRKLWEKKYGDGAKHIQKQAKEQYQSKNRDSGWDMRRGATSQEETRGKYGRNKIPGKRREAVGSYAPQERPVKPITNVKQSNDDKPLHPSWQAAMKRKETKTQAAFQGKKVVFD
ncbi:hypothetical protein FQN49_003685 [Arthroderma sp. PD_2]|nr:hypothetical protein FQN49_003685 [Arthroderma sp. PD_2]